MEMISSSDLSSLPDILKFVWVLCVCKGEKLVEIEPLGSVERGRVSIASRSMEVRCAIDGERLANSRVDALYRDMTWKSEAVLRDATCEKWQERCGGRSWMSAQTRCYEQNRESVWRREEDGFVVVCWLFGLRLEEGIPRTMEGEGEGAVRGDHASTI